MGGGAAGAGSSVLNRPPGAISRWHHRSGSGAAGWRSVSSAGKCSSRGVAVVAFYVLCLLPVAVGLAVGYLRGGRLVHLAGRFRLMWLLWLAAAVQACQYFAPAVRGFFDRMGLSPLWVVFGLGLVWAVANLVRQEEVLRVALVLVFLGAAANGAAVLANGRMPYEPSAAEALGKPGNSETVKNVPATEGTRLRFLGDTIPLPVLAKIISVGDVAIGVGATTLIAAGMRSRRSRPSRTATAQEPGATSLPVQVHEGEGNGEHHA